MPRGTSMGRSKSCVTLIWVSELQTLINYGWLEKPSFYDAERKSSTSHILGHPRCSDLRKTGPGRGLPITMD